jgi:hypothetical protein
MNVPLSINTGQKKRINNRYKMALPCRRCKIIPNGSFVHLLFQQLIHFTYVPFICCSNNLKEIKISSLFVFVSFSFLPLLFQQSISLPFDLTPLTSIKFEINIFITTNTSFDSVFLYWEKFNYRIFTPRFSLLLGRFNSKCSKYFPSFEKSLITRFFHFLDPLIVEIILRLYQEHSTHSYFMFLRGILGFLKLMKNPSKTRFPVRF